MRLNSLKIILLIILATNCTKEQKFKRAIHSEWNIDKIEYGSISDGCGANGYQITLTEENVGTIEFTKEKTESKIALSTTETQYKGVINYANGNQTEFIYEYFGKVYGGHQLSIFDNNYVGLEIEILTNKECIFVMNNYNGGCYYNTKTYYLSK